MKFFEVGQLVRNVGRGTWKVGKVVGLVPPMVDARWFAVHHGFVPNDIRSGCSRLDWGYLVEVEDGGKAPVVRFPFLSWIEAVDCADDVYGVMEVSKGGEA